MFKFIFKFLCFSLLLFSTTTIAKKKCLSMFVVVNDSSGYLNEDGQMAGYHVDFMNELEIYSGICINKKLIPYSRALKGLEYGEYDGGIVAKTTYLNQKVEYVTKLITSKTVIIPKKGITLNNYNDLVDITIGRFRGVDLNGILGTKLQFSLVDLYSYQQGLRMLQKGRIDAIAGNNLGLSIIDQLGMLEDVNLPGSLVIGNREVWFVVSRKSQHLDQIPRLSLGVTSMINDGVFDKILGRYFGENWKLITQ